MESLVKDIIDKSQRVIYGVYSQTIKHIEIYHLEALVTNREDAVEYLKKLLLLGTEKIQKPQGIQGSLRLYGAIRGCQGMQGAYFPPKSAEGHIGKIMQDPLYKEIALRNNIDHKNIMKYSTICDKMYRSEIEYFFKHYLLVSDELELKSEDRYEYITLSNRYIIVEMPLHNKTPSLSAQDDYNFQDN
jgi:hypothetical protein